MELDYLITPIEDFSRNWNTIRRHLRVVIHAHEDVISHAKRLYGEKSFFRLYKGEPAQYVRTWLSMEGIDAACNGASVHWYHKARENGSKPALVFLNVFRPEGDLRLYINPSKEDKDE